MRAMMLYLLGGSVPMHFARFEPVARKVFRHGEINLRAVNLEAQRVCCVCPHRRYDDEEHE